MVSTAIVAIIFSAVVAQLRNSTGLNDINTAFQELRANFESARLYSLAGRVTNDGFPSGGYGIIFRADNNTYDLFADHDNNGILSGADTIVESHKIFGTTQLTGIEYTTGPAAENNWQPIGGNQLTVTFQPPLVTINPSLADATYVRLILNNSVSGQQREFIFSIVNGFSL